MIKLYSMDGCPKCKIVKNRMVENNIEFQEFNVNHDKYAMDYIISKGLSKMPVIETDTIIMNGDETLTIDFEGFRD